MSLDDFSSASVNVGNAKEDSDSDAKENDSDVKDVTRSLQGLFNASEKADSDEETANGSTRVNRYTKRNSFIKTEVNENGIVYDVFMTPVVFILEYIDCYFRLFFPDRQVSILDICCGDGAFRDAFNQRGYLNFNER